MKTDLPHFRDTHEKGKQTSHRTIYIFFIEMTAMPIWLKIAILHRWDGGCSLSDIVNFPEIYFNDEETPESEFWENSDDPREPLLEDEDEPMDITDYESESDDEY